jgi:hypothetical protein
MQRPELMLNDQGQTLSRHSMIQLPDKEHSIVNVNEFITLFPRMVCWFNGKGGIDHCVTTFYKKAAHKHEGQALWIFDSNESLLEVRDIFIEEGGYRFDVPDDEPTTEVRELTEQERQACHEHLADIREGLKRI